MTEPATILDHIGNTPLLRLNHVTDSLDADIYVKCEFATIRWREQRIDPEAAA